MCYEFGQGVEADKARAAQLYKEAAEQGNPWAQCNYGFCLYQGIGVEPDAAGAAEWFRKSAGQGSGRAWFLLGECYERGAGVAQDLAQARTAYRRAADMGYKGAAEALARLDAPKGAALAEEPPAAPKARRGWWPFGKKK